LVNVLKTYQSLPFFLSVVAAYACKR